MYSFFFTSTQDRTGIRQAGISMQKHDRRENRSSYCESPSMLVHITNHNEGRVRDRDTVHKWSIHSLVSCLSQSTVSRHIQYQLLGLIMLSVGCTAWHVFVPWHCSHWKSGNGETPTTLHAPRKRHAIFVSRAIVAGKAKTTSLFLFKGE